MGIFVLEVIIMAILIIYGLNVGGAIGGGSFALFGMLLMVFIFRLPPGNMPIDAILIILAIGISGGVLERSGGVDYLVSVAGKLIKRWPKSVTFIAPLIVFAFVFGVGTSNIALALEPIIAETAMDAGIRPRRPLITSVFAANFGLLCSPAAAATAYIISMLSVHGLTMGRYMQITIPTAIIAIICLSIFESLVGNHGISDHEFVTKVTAKKQATVKAAFSRKEKSAAGLFLLGVLAILILGVFPELQPQWVIAGKLVKLTTTQIVMMLMFTSAAGNLLISRINPKDIFKSRICTAAIGALLAVMGPGWLGSTIFGNANNLKLIKWAVGPAIHSSMWVMVIIIMLVASLVMSQAATSAIVFPIALSLGVTPLFLVAVVQALNTNFVIPAQPTILFAEDVDTTNSTHKYGFIIPGFFIVLISFVVGILMIHL